MSTTTQAPIIQPKIVCGVNSGQGIYCADQNITSSQNWTALPGGLSNISVNSDGSLFGTNSGQGIWYKSNYKDSSIWTQLPGGLSQISSV